MIVITTTDEPEPLVTTRLPLSAIRKISTCLKQVIAHPSEYAVEMLDHVVLPYVHSDRVLQIAVNDDFDVELLKKYSQHSVKVKGKPWKLSDFFTIH